MSKLTEYTKEAADNKMELSIPNLKNCLVE